MSRKSRLLSQSSILFGARIFGAGLIFLVQAGIARAFSSEVLAEYLVLIATVNVAAMIMPMGFQTIGSYFAAEYRATGDKLILKLFIMRAYKHVLIIFGAGSLIAAGIHLLSSSSVLSDHSMWIPFAILALSTATVFVHGAILIGLKHPIAGFFADGLARPLVIVFAFVFAFLLQDRFDELLSIVWIFALLYGAIAVAYAFFCWRAVEALDVTSFELLHENDNLNIASESKRWWRFALPWVMISLATDFFFDLDVLFLSVLLSPHELAVFGVIARMFALTAFGVTAVYAVLLPDMFEAEAKNDRKEFLRQLGDANLVASGCAVVLIIMLGVFGPLILWLFGNDFAEGATPLLILSLILLVRAVVGPTSLILSINNHPWASLPAIGAGLGALSALNVWLVPLWGLNGAAVAALVSVLIWNILLWRETHARTGIDASLLPRFRELFAGRSQSKDGIE